MKQKVSAGSVLVLRGVLVLVTFVGVGLLTFAAVNHMGAVHRTPPAEVRLAAMMAGLFAGGAAASVVLLIVSFGRKQKA